MAGKTHYPTIFLSDIHLGTRGCQADRLNAFLDQHSCDQLFLVGDIVDGWRLKNGFYWPQAHNDIMRRFLALTKEGTQVVYVTGNHDEFLRKYSDAEVGRLKLVDEYVHRTRDGKSMLVIHGDQFDVITRYHKWLAFLGDMGYAILLRANTGLNTCRKHFGYGYWSLSAWIKHRVKRAVNYISEFEGAIAHQCRKLGYDGAICGHIHHAEIRDIDGIRYMNCGDWVESCSALVETPDGSFRIIRWADELPKPSADIIELEPVPQAAAQRRSA